MAASKRHRSGRDPYMLKRTTGVPRVGVGLGPDSSVSEPLHHRWANDIQRADARSLSDDSHTHTNDLAIARTLSRVRRTGSCSLAIVRR